MTRIASGDSSSSSTRRALPSRLCPSLSHELLGLSERSTSFRISFTHERPLLALADADVPHDLPCYYFEATLAAMEMVSLFGSLSSSTTSSNPAKRS